MVVAIDREVSGLVTPRRQVLYLGWDRHPVSALRQLDADVTCVVSPDQRAQPREDGFDGPLVVAGDPADVPGVLAALAAAGTGPGDFWTVCTEDEFAVVPAAVLGNLGSARPGPVGTALALRDKHRQKSLAAAAGVPVPAFALVDDLADLRPDVGLPLVVKPPAGGGALRTWVVPDAAAVDRLRSAPDGPERRGPWLVERFVPGRELHVDGVVRGGRVLLASVSRYLSNVIEVHFGRLVGSATVDDPRLVDRAARLTRDTLRALGHHDGVFHLEAFDRPGAPLVLGECAGRLGGGMIAEQVRHRHGVDLYREWAAAVLGRPPFAGPARPAPGSYGWVNLPVPAGRIRSLPSRERIEDQPGVVEAQLWAAVGEVVGDMTLGSHLLVAKALVRAPTETEVRGRLEQLGRWFAAEAVVDGDG